MKQCLFILLLFCFMCSNCTTKTQVYEQQVNKELRGNKIIFVKKIDEVSRMVGALSGHLWNEEHRFHYEFTIEPQEIEWKGLIGEAPKSLVSCQTVLLLKTTTRQVVTDSIKGTYTLTASNFYKHVDKRYFFKLFGEQYFVTIDSLSYQAKAAGCLEEAMPNL